MREKISKPKPKKPKPEFNGEVSERVWNNIQKMLDKLESDLEAERIAETKLLAMYTTTGTASAT